MLTVSNYELALVQLDTRYSNRRAIAENHLDELFDASIVSFWKADTMIQLLNIITSSL